MGRNEEVVEFKHLRELISGDICMRQELTRRAYEDRQI